MNPRLMARLVLVACGACGGAGNNPMSDSPPQPIDAASSDGSTCTPPNTCDWLEPYQRTIVATLAGETEITPGIRLLHRATASERDATRQYLLKQLTALGYTAGTADYATGKNVIAQLDATTAPGGLIVVGAHFDGVIAGHAAADNATGVAVVLAAARYLRDVPVRHHPVAFILFDEEELGLKGSKAYAASLVAAGVEVTGVHVFDMLSFDGDGDHAVELWSPSPTLLTLYQQQGPLAGTPIQPVTFASSDHQAFLDAGFPAVGLCEEFVGGDHTPSYHTAADTYDRIAFEYLGRATRLGLAALESSITSP